jgi:hypothetical protein
LFDELNISGVDVPFVLANGNRQAGQSSQPVTLYLTVIVSPNTTSYPILPINAFNAQSTEVNESPLSEATSPMAQDSTNTTRSSVATGSGSLSLPTNRIPSTPMPLVTDRRVEMSPAEDALRDTDEVVTTTTNTTRPVVATGSETLSPSTDRLPSEMSAPMPPATDRGAGMSPAEDALHDAKEVMATIKLSKTWEGALERIKWVMDTLSPVAGVRRNVPFSNP